MYKYSAFKEETVLEAFIEVLVWWLDVFSLKLVRFCFGGILVWLLLTNTWWVHVYKFFNLIGIGV